MLISLGAYLSVLSAHLSRIINFKCAKWLAINVRMSQLTVIISLIKNKQQSYFWIRVLNSERTHRCLWILKALYVPLICSDSVLYWQKAHIAKLLDAIPFGLRVRTTAGFPVIFGGCVNCVGKWMACYLYPHSETRPRRDVRVCRNARLSYERLLQF